MESVRTRRRDSRMIFKLGVAVALLGALSVVIVLQLGGATRVRIPVPPPASPTRVAVWVDARHPGAPVPARFLGLSFEVSSAAQISRYAGSGDFAELLRSLGPGVLRLGGASADTRVAWSDPLTARPAWASGVLRPADLRRLARLARATGWRVLLTIGLVHYEPRAAAREAAAANAALGPLLMGIELGNEPDSYGRHGQRRRSWGASAYNAQVGAYRRAIAQAAPGIAVAGPGVSGSSAFEQWGPAEVLAQKPALLTGHHYPLGCHTAAPPTAEQLLSQATRGLESRSLQRYLSVARASGIPFRMDETNSVSCGGRAGLSNTFAAALWAVGYIAQAMAAGAAGINLEGNPASCMSYSPVCATSPSDLASGALHPQPEWYALLLTRGLVGDRPLHTIIAPHRQANVAITTFRGPAGAVKLVIVEDDPPGSKAVALRLHVGGGRRTAEALALTAPSPHATSGVRLGRQAVSARGAWNGPSQARRLNGGDGVIAVTVAPSSAVLITVAPVRGPQRGRRAAPPTDSCGRTACARGQRSPRAAPPRRASSLGSAKSRVAPLSHRRPARVRTRGV